MSRRTWAGIGGLFWLTVGLLRLSMGQGGLVSLSPETLDYVVQDEVTLLWGQWSVYRSTPVKRDNELLTFLSQEGFVARIPARIGRLELIEHWNPAWRDGHGVLRRLFLHDRREVFEWSTSHPEVARRYWAEGFRGLRSADRKENCLGQQILLTCRDCETVQELDDRIAALRKEIDEMFR
jgi:hypothetical protein